MLKLDTQKAVLCRKRLCGRSWGRIPRTLVSGLGFVTGPRICRPMSYRFVGYPPKKAKHAGSKNGLKSPATCCSKFHLHPLRKAEALKFLKSEPLGLRLRALRFEGFGFWGLCIHPPRLCPPRRQITQWRTPFCFVG